MSDLAGVSIYTIAQIASALGRPVRGIRKALDQAPPTRPSCGSGRAVVPAGWSFSDMPERLRAQLTGLMNRFGYRSIEALFDSPPQPFSMPIPWAKISSAYRAKAEKQRLAMAELLARRDSLPDLQERGLLEWRRVHGHSIKAGTWWALFKEAQKRDAGQEQWQRIDLYVDSHAFRSAPTPVNVGAISHVCLEPVIRDWVIRKEKLPAHRSALLHEIFRHYEDLIGGKTGKAARAVKRSLCSYLASALPDVCRSQAAASVRHWFNDNYREWIRGRRLADALIDGRTQNSGRPGYCCPECEPKIRAVAARFRGERARRGNVSLAVEKLLATGELCPRCMERRRSATLTSSERARVTPNAFEVAFVKGPEAVRRIAPTHHCMWDSDAGDYFVTDDETPNELAWDEVNGETVSGQVQVLFTEDEASSYPLPFYMYFGHPCSRTIKMSLFLVFTGVGLPHKALVTERGVYNNRMLAGDRSAKNQLSFLHLEAALSSMISFGPAEEEVIARLREHSPGLQDPAFGLSIRQARSPQAKTVERTFYEHQKRASILPGFGGFNQRFEQTRSQQDFVRRVAAGQEHPGNEWLHISELRKNYEAIHQEMANRRINGGRHRGRTPMDMWQEGLNRRPLRKLPEEIYALFATDRLPRVKVTPRGIRVRLDKFSEGWYFGDHTGPLVGTSVPVYINYATPEFIHIEHPVSGTLLKVNRILLKRHSATPEEIAASNSARRAHITGARGQAGNVENLVASWVVRDTDHSPADMKRGASILRAQEEHRATARAESELMTSIRRNADLLGRPLPGRIPDPEAYLQGQEWELEALGLRTSEAGND